MKISKNKQTSSNLTSLFWLPDKSRIHHLQEPIIPCHLNSRVSSGSKLAFYLYDFLFDKFNSQFHLWCPEPSLKMPLREDLIWEYLNLRHKLFCASEAEQSSLFSCWSRSGIKKIKNKKNKKTFLVVSLYKSRTAELCEAAKFLVTSKL